MHDITPSGRTLRASPVWSVWDSDRIKSAVHMKAAFFSTKQYDRSSFEAANKHYAHELVFLEAHLTDLTAALAAGCGAVCVFVNDTLDAAVLEALRRHGVRLIALRSAGFNNVDLRAAESLGFTVARVPAYSPHSVA